MNSTILSMFILRIYIKCWDVYVDEMSWCYTYMQELLMPF